MLLLFFSYLCCPSLPVVAENDDVVVAVLSYLCCIRLVVAGAALAVSGILIYRRSWHVMNVNGVFTRCGRGKHKEVI